MSSTSIFSPPISTIQASSTASAVSTYIPPFATTATFVASSATTHSLASGARPTPTVTGFPANPSTPAFQDDLDWVSAYLLIHSLSQNSYVYAYIFWFAIALIFSLLSLLHNAGARGGVLGAWWSKWALRRRTWRKSVSQTAHRQPWSLPSNAQLLSVVCLSLAVAALCVVGPNYLNPNAGLFNFSVPRKISKRDDFNPSVVQIFQAQYTIPKSIWSSAARAGAVAVMLLPLTVLLALKAPPFAIFAIPYTAQFHFDKLFRLHRWAGRLVWLAVLVHVVLWCIELGRNRRPSTGKLVWNYVFLYNKFIFGWVAFIALTLLTLLSLRPVRNLRYPIFYNSHIFLTPVVLVFTALHHPPVWWWAWAALFIWIGERLWRATFWVYINGLWGFNDSKKWVPPPSSAQETARESRGSVVEKRTNSSIGFKNKHYSTSTGQETIEMSPISPTPRRAPGGNSLIPPDAHTSPDALHPPGRASFGFWDPHYLDRDGLHTPSGSIDSIAYFGDERGEASTPLSFNSKTALAGLGSIPAPSPSPAPGVGAIARNATTYTPQVPVPPGFAHATLLPGRTVRLRILPRGAFSWAPGQHVLVGVPAVSRLSTHPFSIASVCDELTVAPEAAAHAAEKGANNEVLVSHNGLELVILIRAKKGWTRRLWNLIDAMQGRGERILPSERSQLPSGYTLPAVDRSASGGGFNAMGGVLLRTLIDGPFGSTARTRWGDYSSVLIVAGGSGVSFGVSILEYYCLCMSGRDGRYLGTRISGSPWAKGGWKTERVRFIWLVREYSHIQWCATSLRRCLALLPSSHALEVNIFVTHYKPPREIRQSAQGYPGVAQLAAEEGYNDDLLRPPAPRFAQKSRREGSTSSASSLMSDSESSIGSEDSDNSYADLDYDFDNFGDHRQEGQDAENNIEGSHDDGHEHESGLGHEEHVLDYTNFDGDDDEPLPGETHLSRKLKKEGKLRRAKTKKTLKARLAKKALDVRSGLALNGSKSPSGVNTPLPRPTSSIAIEVYPEATKRASAMSSDPLLAASSTSPPVSPGAGADDEHGGRFAAMQNLASRLSTTPSSRLSVVGDDVAHHNPVRPLLSARPISGLSTLSTASSVVDVRQTNDRDARWLDLQEGKLTIDTQELQDIRIISEVAHPGKPKLDRILQNEVEDSKGRLAVCCCGPTSLNALMRKYVAAQISPSKILKGDMRGSIDFITEDFEY